MTITAIIRSDGQEARLRAEDGALEVEGEGDFPAFVRSLFRPGALALYNPRRGGPYEGVDPSDEIQILDGLAWLKRRGAGVEIAAREVPELDVPAKGYGIVDTRDANAQIAARRPEDAPPLIEGA